MVIWFVCEFFCLKKRNLTVREFSNNETAYFKSVEVTDGHFPSKIKWHIIYKQKRKLTVIQSRVILYNEKGFDGQFTL